MANDAGVPLVKVLQHPRIGISPSIDIVIDVCINNLQLCHTHHQPAEGEQKNLLQVDPVATGRAIEEVAGRDGEFHRHRLELALDIKGRVKTTQLTPIEVCHL